MNITVFLGSRNGNDERFEAAARELGRWIGGHGHRLIYGGSRSGLMGEVASSALEAGGEVVGIEPRMFVDAGYVYDDITELIVTEDMSERKKKLINMGNVCIVFPGGTGTLEEMGEVMSSLSLGLTDGICVVYNLFHYYDGVKQLLDNMLRYDLSTEEQLKGICFAESFDEIIEIISYNSGK